MEGKFDVVIVGGGPAGLSLAIGLSDHGHTVAVLEARKGVSPVKRGTSLSPNGLKVLKSYENSRRPHTEFMQDMAERTAS